MYATDEEKVKSLKDLIQAFVNLSTEVIISETINRHGVYDLGHRKPTPILDDFKYNFPYEMDFRPGYRLISSVGMPDVTLELQTLETYKAAFKTFADKNKTDVTLTREVNQFIDDSPNEFLALTPSKPYTNLDTKNILNQLDAIVEQAFPGYILSDDNFLYEDSGEAEGMKVTFKLTNILSFTVMIKHKDREKFLPVYEFCTRENGKNDGYMTSIEKFVYDDALSEENRGPFGGYETVKLSMSEKKLIAWEIDRRIKELVNILGTLEEAKG